MDDTEDDARYPPNPYGVNQDYGSSHRQKLPVRNAPYSQHVGNHYHVDVDDDDDDDDVQAEEEVEEEEDEGEDEQNGIQPNGNGEDDYDNDDRDKDDDDNRSDYSRRIENADVRHQKKRKLKSLLSNYEFAPRVAAPSTATGSVPKPSFGGRNSLADWTEHESFVLLDAWGERFLQRGRKSLRSDEWQEVAEAVSQESNFNRTDTQCRNRLDTLKKKYKKEKMRVEGVVGATSKWVYFKKMDMLMSSSPPKVGLLCGVDSGEYVLKNPRACLNNHANVSDKMRDSPGNSESAEGEDDEDDSDLLPPRRTRTQGNRGDDGASSFRLLADSIYKFSEIYEKTESSKRQQMLELEKMRMDFHRDLELQKRKMLERAQAEIAKIRQGEDEENGVSAENISG